MKTPKSHWENIYNEKSSDELSWTQSSPSPSIDWIKSALPDRNSHVIDVGGGNSLLVDALISEGYLFPAALDLSQAALDKARKRLGALDPKVEWIESDVTEYRISRTFSLWHDRAVFHFLTKSEDRARYKEVLKRTIKPNGKVILATFSPTGPEKCSGLDVLRYDELGLSSEFQDGFVLERSERITHYTPWGNPQDFLYCLLKKNP